MPPELLKAISDMLKSLRTPAGAAGSGPIGRDEKGRFVNKGQEVLAFAIEKLNKTLSGRGGDEATKLLGRRKDRIRLNELQDSISGIVEKSNKLYAVDKFMKEQGLANKNAAFRLLQLRNPQLLKSISYKARYGSDAEKVMAAEQEAVTASLSTTDSGFQNIKTAIKVIGTFAAGFATGYHAMTGLMRFFAEANTGMTKFNAQIHNINKLFTINERVMTAFAATGMDAVKASGAAGKLEVFAAGLPYGRGIDKLSAMAMAGLDISGINPMEDTGEDIIRKLAPQVQKMSARERARVVALGGMDESMMRAAQNYGKSFDKLDWTEQVNVQDAAWEERLNRLRMEAMSLPQKERIARLGFIKGLEELGPHGWMYNEEVFGQTALEMQMAQAERREDYNRPDATKVYENVKRRAREVYISSHTKMVSVPTINAYGGALVAGSRTEYLPPSEEELERWSAKYDEKYLPGADTTALFRSGTSTSETKNITVDMSGATFNVTGDNATDISQDILSQVSDGIVIAIQNNEEK